MFAAVTIRAVLFDFGGVITTSPFEAFNSYEAEAGLPLDLIRSINATNGDDNAWARFERSEVDVDGFVDLFEAEAAVLGLRVDGHRVLGCLSGDLRPEMVNALDIISGSFRIACITNNVASSSEDPIDFGPRVAVRAVMDRFEVVVESSKVGLRKPDPAIYHLACSLLDVDPSEAVYLDDLGINCKPARAMGMTTIKVLDGQQALIDLQNVLGIDLQP